MKLPARSEQDAKSPGTNAGADDASDIVGRVADRPLTQPTISAKGTRSFISVMTRKGRPG